MPKKCVVLLGPPQSGKTTTGLLLARHSCKTSGKRIEYCSVGAGVRERKGEYWSFENLVVPSAPSADNRHAEDTAPSSAQQGHSDHRVPAKDTHEVANYDGACEKGSVEQDDVRAEGRTEELGTAVLREALARDVDMLYLDGVKCAEHAMHLIDLLEEYSYELSGALLFCASEVTAGRRPQRPDDDEHVLARRRERWATESIAVCQVIASRCSMAAVRIKAEDGQRSNYDWRLLLPAEFATELDVDAFRDAVEGRVALVSSRHMKLCGLGYVFTHPPPACFELVSSLRMRDELLAALHAALGRTDAEMCAVGNMVTAGEDLAYVVYSGRYLHSPKLDGSRFWMCYLPTVSPSHLFFMDRRRMFWRVPAAAYDTDFQWRALSAALVMDGEVLSPEEPVEDFQHDLQRKTTFVVFDTLCARTGPVWWRPLDERIALADYSSFPVHAHSLAVQPKKWKKFDDRALNALARSLRRGRDRARSALPSDGLILAPCDLAYTFGADTTQFKLQDAEEVRVEVRVSTFLRLGGPDGFQRHFVASSEADEGDEEATADGDGARAPVVVATVGPRDVDVAKLAVDAMLSLRLDVGSRWVAAGVRWDKRRENSRATIAACVQFASGGDAWVREDTHSLVRSAMRVRMTRPSVPSHSLPSDYDPVECARAVASGDDAQPDRFTRIIHPARLLSFAELMRRAAALEEQGSVERWRDAESGLEVLSAVPRACDSGAWRTAMFRGLVVHPETQTLVATPFVRFDADASSLSHPYRLHCALDRSARSVRDVVQMTEKFDGSLVIAFYWCGRVYTSTKRRMDSQQAQWAKRWLEARYDADRLRRLFQGRRTLLFEALCAENMLGIEYHWEGLVLLGVIDRHGVERSHEEMAELANSYGLRYPTRVRCLMEDALGWEERFASAEVPRSEGFVVEYPLVAESGKEPGELQRVGRDGFSGRCKLVWDSYRRIRGAVARVHPLYVWEDMAMGRSDRLLAALEGLPSYAQEYRRMLLCLRAGWQRVWRALLRLALGDGVPGAAQDKETEADLRMLSIGIDGAMCLDGKVLPVLQQKAMSCEEMIACARSLPADARASLDAMQPEACDYALFQAVCYRVKPRPPFSTSLAGYSPSAHLVQTVCKGWEAVHDVVLVPVDGLGTLRTLPRELLLYVLSHVGGRDLARSRAVSREWASMVNRAFEAQICQARSEASEIEEEDGISYLRAGKTRYMDMQYGDYEWSPRRILSSSP